MQPGERAEIQAIRDELNGLRAQVDAVRSGGGPSRWGRAIARPRLSKRLTRVGLVTLMLALPVTISASHQFTDVPNSHTFHSAISRLYGARLTTGCTATTFCPSANVSRGQMAAFLNRGLGRASSGWNATGYNDDWAALNDNSLGTLTLVHGGATGGTGLVLFTASVTAYTKQVGVCPCALAVWVRDTNSGEESPAMFQTITDIASPPDANAFSWYETSVSINHTFIVPSGVTHAYVLGVAIHPTTPPTDVNGSGAEWSMTAVYIPFGWNGGNPSLSTTQAVDGRRSH